MMKIGRTITRRIEVTAAEVYAALAKAHDLSTDKPSEAYFDHGDTRSTGITLVHISAFEQELAE